MKKLAFYSIERSNEISESYIKKLVEKLRKNGAEQCRIYEQDLEGEKYFFGFIETEKSFESDWMSARHVYEFAQREGDDFTNLEKRGIIIGVADGKLEEYVRLHDEQPQIIHDLCYQNGFRKSSIFAFPTLSGNWYLLQFVEYKGKEDPRLYENPTYQEWLRVTGECQKPLPGEKFWKDMKLLFQYRK